MCTVQLVYLHGGTLKATGPLHQAVSARDLPHLNQDNYSSTVLLRISPAGWRQLGLCKDTVADFVLGIPRPNFLGDALLTSVRATEGEFCRAESRNKFSFSRQSLSDIMPSCSC